MKQEIKRMMRYVLHGIPNITNVKAEISYLQPNKRLVGKGIVVTGGSRGLGFAMAEKFVNEGADVLITGRNEAALKETAEKCRCKYLVLDVTQFDKFHDFIEEANALLDNHLNALVNNAGISLHEETFFDVTPKTFDAQVNTNLKGGFFLTQEFVKFMKKKNRKATILFTSSETGDTMDYRPYGFTKSAVNSMVQGLAYLFAKENIRVNAVAPGVTASEMTGISKDGNLYLAYNHTDRAYLPEEVAETACFLLSDASGCISGQIITCNNAKTVNARWK